MTRSLDDIDAGIELGRKVAREMLIRGRVQGLGVRPAIARLALRLSLNGSVRNTPEGVLIRLEGAVSEVNRFHAMLPEELPCSAQFHVNRMTDTQLSGCLEFRIDTDCDLGVAPAVEVPVDRATCQECLKELTDQTDRRFEYAFSSCTNCGPRYSILNSMPYERRDTSMVAFHLCSLCDAEYRNSEDRRFHAQTVVCPNCGPRLWFESAAPSSRDTGFDAITAAAEVVRSGGILALKGLGGYQLICDATHDDAVQRLRDRKRRCTKPLAIMIAACEINQLHKSSRSLNNAGWDQRPVSRAEPPDSDYPLDGPALALLAGPTLRVRSIAECVLLNSPVNPIVILENATLPSLAWNVSPEINSLGVMLPTTPLHALLLNELQTPLVVTSGNQNSEPLSYQESNARMQLEGVADGWLHHDRKIERPIDDSVVRIIAGEVATIRAARGIAPLRLGIPTQHSILAVGGDQKVAIALSNGRQTILGPHIGEMSGLVSRQRFIEQVTVLQTLYGARPTVIAHDSHPDYFTTRWAAEQGLQTMAIQHHHAHVVSGMLQHGLLDQRVLGIAFDGTGYGTDGTIWGGEFLLTTKTEFQRVASLMPFVLPGGEAAIREPWRVAVSLLSLACPEMTAEQIAEMWNFDCRTECRTGLQTRPEEKLQQDGSGDRSCDKRSTGKSFRQPAVAQIRNVQQLVKARIGPLTSSVGRLFDGVASLLLGIVESGYEGEPAMRLEAICEVTSEQSEPTVVGPLISDDVIRIDWRPIVRQIVEDIQAGRSASATAMQFHRVIASAAAVMAEEFPTYSVVLSGGCFQNRILTELVTDKLRRQGRTVTTPSTIPCNDGGLAAGQIAIAAARLEASDQPENLSCA